MAQTIRNIFVNIMVSLVVEVLQINVVLMMRIPVKLDIVQRSEYQLVRDLLLEPPNDLVMLIELCRIRCERLLHRQAGKKIIFFKAVQFELRVNTYHCIVLFINNTKILNSISSEINKKIIKKIPKSSKAQNLRIKKRMIIS